MPSFDIVSKVDMHELTNAVDQTNRELSQRFDFKGTHARVELTKIQLIIIGPTDFHLKQIDEILRNRLSKRNIDVRSLEYKTPSIALHEARQEIDIHQGLSGEHAKEVVHAIRDMNLKVQAAIQSDQVRVTAKKRDDLQEVIAKLRIATLSVPLQFENFRD